MSDSEQTRLMRQALALLAPGTALRDGVERVLGGRTGGLIVLGYDSLVDSLCQDGFRIDVEFTPARLRELSKMDGAVVLSAGGDKIIRANVHLIANPEIPSDETGTRHRTAERFSIHAATVVISVSTAGVAIVYAGGMRKVLATPSVQLAEAGESLSTLDFLCARIARSVSSLTESEISQTTTIGQVTELLHRTRRARLLATEIADQVDALGTMGRVAGIRLAELSGELERLYERTHAAIGYSPNVPGCRATQRITYE